MENKITSEAQIYILCLTIKDPACSAYVKGKAASGASTLDISWACRVGGN